MGVWKWLVSGNKTSVEICEINNIGYLQKLIYTERNKKNYATIFTPIDSPHQALSKHPKIITIN